MITTEAAGSRGARLLREQEARSARSLPLAFFRRRFTDSGDVRHREAKAAPAALRGGRAAGEQGGEEGRQQPWDEQTNDSRRRRRR